MVVRWTTKSFTQSSLELRQLSTAQRMASVELAAVVVKPVDAKLAEVKIVAPGRMLAIVSMPGVSGRGEFLLSRAHDIDFPKHRYDSGVLDSISSFHWTQPPSASLFSRQQRLRRLFCSTSGHLLSEASHATPAYPYARLINLTKLFERYQDIAAYEKMMQRSY